LEASTIPSLYTAFIGEIEGEGIFADAALEPYSRQWREPPSKGARRLSRASAIDPGHEVDRRRWL
jgi:hypothetical protein